MSEEPDSAIAIWADSLVAAALLAVDPFGLSGIVVRGRSGPVREHWLEALTKSTHGLGAVRRLPAAVGEDRLLGGLDLPATLATGRPVAQPGLLAAADGGMLVAPSAERMSPTTTSHICRALDTGQIVLEREGLARLLDARLAVVALDEGAEADEHVPPSLAERLAFRIDLDTLSHRDCEPTELYQPADIVAARARIGTVEVPDDVVAALCGAAVALGIPSPRAPLLAVRAARAAAALDGRDIVGSDEAGLAARLVLAHRATRLPQQADDEQPQQQPPDEPPPPQDQDDQAASSSEPQPLDDVILAAAVAALPPDLLAALSDQGRAQRSSSSGRSQARHASKRRGRPIGVRAGAPEHGARLDIVATLRAAAPWQTLRRRGRPTAPADTDASLQRRVDVRRDDFRIKRLETPAETTTLFVVDASGSAALARLAEAKGAVELLLADCYVRRDQVALIAFRGLTADVVLPPTRSLVRAKRSLAGLPGGGGTPIAAGLDAAVMLAGALRRKGQTPIVVVLTDGRANISRDGKPGRPVAEADAVDAARRLRVAGIDCLLVDTSTRPEPAARRLADAMDAHYLPLPHADAARISQAVRRTSSTAGP